MIEVGLLGPVEIRVDERRCTLGGRKERAVLSLLAIRAGRVVQLDWLADQLWNGRPPRSAVNTMQSYLSRLRARLGPQYKEVVGREGEGYVLRDSARVDATDFTVACERAGAALASGAFDGALAHGRLALGLWRGVPFLGIDDIEAIDRERRRLLELRADAVLDSAEAAVILGGALDSGLLVDLDELGALYPWRERIWYVKSRVLYRLDRYSEAVACVASAISALRQQKGLEPPGLLVDLEQRLLRHDHSLRPPHGEPLRHGEEHPPERLDGGWRSHSDGPPIAVMLAGEPVTGTTEIAAEFARRLAESGGRALHEIRNIAEVELGETRARANNETPGGGYTRTNPSPKMLIWLARDSAGCSCSAAHDRNCAVGDTGKAICNGAADTSILLVIIL
jgi:DNA-binding SARP family transcriptional activator